MESTGDLVSMVNDINEKEIPIQEEVDLELVDEHLKEKDREIDERYDNFDQHMPEDWTEGKSILSGGEQTGHYPDSPC